MLHNYVKIAWRNLRRNKLFSVQTISGLALGIGCSLLIGLWVRDKLSVNRYHQNGPFFWLQDFEYHIVISGWVFVIAGLLAIGIALVTVSFQSVKAALTNPETSLRSE